MSAHSESGDLTSSINPQSIRIRKASGEVSTDRPLVTFLYLLMRDEMAPGTVAKLMNEAELSDKTGEALFCNGWLAKYAEYVANHLAPVSLLHFDSAANKLRAVLEQRFPSFKWTVSPVMIRADDFHPVRKVMAGKTALKAEFDVNADAMHLAPEEEEQRVVAFVQAITLELGVDPV